MSQKKLITILTLGTLVIAVAFGAVAYQSAKAAANTPTTSTATTDSVLFNNGFGKGMREGPGGGITRSELATALGITVDELNTAYDKASAAALQQAIDQGLITQAQADELKANGTAFPFGGHWDNWLSQKGIDYDALLAEALGITGDQLQAAYIKAYDTKIDQAVTDGNLTQEQADLLKGQYALYNNQNFQSAMQSAYESAVQQAVTEGVITQAQADQILANGNGLHFGGGPGFGRMGGGHGFGRHGMQGGEPMGSDTQVAPTATP